MRFSPPRRPIVAALAALALTATEARAQFTNYFFFGDSFSDTGNILLATSAPGSPLPPTPPSPPYAIGRFSNGPVWVDFLANALGRPNAARPGGLQVPVPPPAPPGTLLPILPPLALRGNNYAIGGALAGTGGAVPGTGVQAQTAFARSQIGPLDPGALYVVFAGGNDAIAAARAGTPAAAATAASDLGLAIQNLYLGGARNFLVPNLPNVGEAPTLVAGGFGANGLAATNAFNTALNGTLNTLGGLPGMNIRRLDTFTLFNDILTDARSGGAVFGFTNTTVPCLPGFLGSTGRDCNVSIFADDLHPTSRLHSILAARALAVAVPEPSTYIMLATGLAALALASRTRSRARR